MHGGPNPTHEGRRAKQQFPRQAANRSRFRRDMSVVLHPYFLETSVPGSFAAGDVRRGAVKRLASAVGEGAMCVTFVHRYLRETM
jgi:thioredoxin reductase